MKFIKNTTGTIGARIYNDQSEIHIGHISEGKENLIEALQDIYFRKFKIDAISQRTINKLVKVIENEK